MLQRCSSRIRGSGSRHSEPRLRVSNSPANSTPLPAPCPLLWAGQAQPRSARLLELAGPPSGEACKGTVLGKDPTYPSSTGSCHRPRDPHRPSGNGRRKLSLASLALVGVEELLSPHAPRRPPSSKNLAPPAPSEGEREDDRPVAEARRRPRQDREQPVNLLGAEPSR